MPYAPRDAFDLFEAEQAKARRESVAEQTARLERSEHLQLEVEQRRRDAMREWSRQSNDKMIEDQYRAAGIARPSNTNVSLSMLMSLGWTIQDGPAGGRVLVKPPEPEAWSGPTDHDSLPRPSKRKKAK